MTYTAAGGKASSLTHGARPGIKPTSSWILVRFTTRCATTGTPRHLILMLPHLQGSLPPLPTPNPTLKAPHPPGKEPLESQGPYLQNRSHRLCSGRWCPRSSHDHTASCSQWALEGTGKALEKRSREAPGKGLTSNHPPTLIPEVLPAPLPNPQMCQSNCYAAGRGSDTQEGSPRLRPPGSQEKQHRSGR